MYPNDCYTLSMYKFILNNFSILFINFYFFLGGDYEDDCNSSEDSCPDIPDSYIESLSMLILIISLPLDILFHLTFISI